MPPTSHPSPSGSPLTTPPATTPPEPPSFEATKEDLIGNVIGQKKGFAVNWRAAAFVTVAVLAVVWLLRRKS